MYDQFVNEPPVINRSSSFSTMPVGPLSTIQSKFRNQAESFERFESWPNGLEAGWMVYEQP